MSFYPNWVYYQAERFGIEPEDIYGPPIESDSDERCQALLEYIQGEMRIGMVDQGAANPDGSPNITELIDFAEEERLQPFLIGYLSRNRGFTTEDLEPILNRLKRPRETLLRYIAPDERPEDG